MDRIADMHIKTFLIKPCETVTEPVFGMLDLREVSFAELVSKLLAV